MVHQTDWCSRLVARQAIEQTAAYYSALFNDAPELQRTESYAMKEGTLPTRKRRERLSEFFFWTAWAAATERPEGGSTYTNNWPHEPLIDNVPTAENHHLVNRQYCSADRRWGGLIWVWAFRAGKMRKNLQAPERDP